MNQCRPEWFYQHLGNYFTSPDKPLLEQWLCLIQDPDKIRQLQQNAVFSADNKTLDKLLKGFGAQKSEIKEVLKGLKTELTKLAEELFSGNRHRKEYLEAIFQEIKHDSRLKKVREAVGIEPLWRLIGNLSNLQLRASRWYFNDPAMSEADYWDETRLHNVFVRWLKFWSPQTPEEKANRATALQLLQCTPDVLDALCRLNPEFSIPPYENQNNRRPPKDQTLWLNPEQLERQFPKWRYWSQRLLRKHPEYMEGIDEILCLYDRKSRLSKTHSGKISQPSVSVEDLKLSYGLQRLLDRNSHLDAYRLRLLVKNRRSNSTQAALSALQRDLGSQHLEGFLALCSQYYSEVTSARVGLWQEQPQNLLERSHLNPPHKSKILPILVSSLLRVDLDAAGLRAFRLALWNKPVARFNTLRNACCGIEKVRKKYGEHYNQKLQHLRTGVEAQTINPSQLDSQEGDKQIWKSWKDTLEVSAAIQQYFGHTQQQCSKYQNPYSIAQLYNLLETDSKGFSSTTLAAHLENHWRMKQVEIEGVMRSRCSRLPADSIRPFDGVLRRVLERQAWEIAMLKADQIKAAQHYKTKIKIPLLIEQNRFTSAIELIKIKSNPGAKDAPRKNAIAKLEAERAQWLDKKQRIKNASMGICPYSGRALGERGEVDHILSRAVSLLSDDTSYNSEPNLIWCLREDNQDKRASRYCFDDLHDNYLKIRFGRQDRAGIKQEIEAQVSALSPNFAFAALSEQQQCAVRHALFLNDSSLAFQKVKRWLMSQKTARVNGTQSWLIHKIKQCLNRLLDDWCREQQCQLQFSAARIDPYSVHSVRTRLGQHCPDLVKQKEQSVASHAIDALCVLAVAASQHSVAASLCLDNRLASHPKSLIKILPSSISIKQLKPKPLYRKQDIASRQLFKAGIYAEHFFHLWLDNTGLRVGFNPKKSLLVTGNDPKQLAKYLSPFFKDDCDLSEASNSAKPILLRIDKQKALNHLHQVAKEVCSDRAVLQAQLLDGLRFTTKKENVWAQCTDINKKFTVTRDQILKESKFELKVKLPSKCDFKLSGKLLHPAIDDWKAFIDRNGIRELIGSKEKLTSDMHQLAHAYFNAGCKRPHWKERREFSLPVPQNPSGGVRIRRKDPQGGYIWQLHTYEDTFSCGLTVEDGMIQWGKNVAIEAFRKSPNIHQRTKDNKSTIYSQAEQIVMFDHWLPIDADILDSLHTQVEMAPATVDRRYVRIRQPFSVFKQWMQDCDAKIAETPFGLDSEITLDPRQFLNNHGLKMIGSPRGDKKGKNGKKARGKLLIEQAGELMCYRYYASKSKETNAAYQQAYTKSLEVTEVDPQSKALSSSTKQASDTQSQQFLEDICAT